MTKMQEELTIEVKIRRVTFQKDEFAIISVDRLDRKESFDVKGNLSRFQVGEKIKIVGQFEVHQKYGQQFKASYAYPIMPNTVDGIREYLINAKIKGLGPAMIEKILQAFGVNALKIIEEEPKRLLEIKGLTEKKVDQMMSLLGKSTAQHDTMVFLHQLEIRPAIAGKIWAKYGKQSLDHIKENPFMMMREIEGYTFWIADLVCKRLNFPMNHPHRIAGMFDMALLEAQEDGHVCLPRYILYQRVYQLYPDDQLVNEVLSKQIQSLQLKEIFFQNTSFVYLPWYDEIEKDASKRILARTQDQVDLLKPDLSRFEKKSGLILAQEQKQAVECASETSVMLLTGGPGTGKTTIVDALIDLFENYQLKIKLAAPTGRAARRLSETTGKDAMTIHRLLDFVPNEQYFKRDEENPIEADVVIIDEFSMVDLKLFHALLKALPRKCRLIMVGDANQLPSVSPGRVYRDLIESKLLKTIVLKQIFRQTDESQIVLNAYRILNGEPIQISKDATLGDFFNAKVSSPKDAVELIKQLIKDRIPKTFAIPSEEIQVLVPVYKGECGADALNEMLQNLINPKKGFEKVIPKIQPSVQLDEEEDEEEDEISEQAIKSQPIQSAQSTQSTQSAQSTQSTQSAQSIPSVQAETQVVKDGKIKFSDIRVGDRVMQLKNAYDQEIYNGDIGIVKAKAQDQLSVQFDDKIVVLSREQSNALGLAYACSIHKSQGSEYSAVILPVLEEYSNMLQRDLLYTAVTRAKKLLVLISQPRALTRAIESINNQQRYSGLYNRLIEQAK